MSERLERLQALLLQYAVPPEQRKVCFFKTAPGEYAEHDQFLGVPTPRLRIIAKAHQSLEMPVIIELLYHPANESRLLALFILIEQYKKGDAATRTTLFKIYQKHINQINNWNLVDASAHLIIGQHLWKKEQDYLETLAHSTSLWHRRIAIISTWYFIKKNDFLCTMKLSQILLNDPEDLIHKAVGWMLREIGKRDEKVLLEFLDHHAEAMPRTMLRYAIEKLSPEQRQHYKTLS